MGGLPAFCQHFLAPLALMSLTDIRLNQLCRTNLDGVPLDLTSQLLPWRSRLRFGLSLHLHLHGAMQRTAPESPGAKSPGRFSRSAMNGLIDSLESAVRRTDLEDRAISLGFLLRREHLFIGRA